MIDEITVDILECENIPRKKNIDDAGYDLCSTEAGLVVAGGKTTFRTGIFVAIPHGIYAKMESRSGLARDFDIEVGAGVIDAPYRGELCVMLRNHGSKDFMVNIGDRIAQVIFSECKYVTFRTVDSLPPSNRGVDGFGSSGVKPFEVGK